MNYREALPRFMLEKKLSLQELVADDIFDIAHSLAEGHYDVKGEEWVKIRLIHFNKILENLEQGVIDGVELHKSELREFEAEKIADAIIDRELLGAA